MQVRTHDEKTKEIVDRINHAETLFCLRTEREFLRLLQGDCGSPVSVLAIVEATRVRVRAQVFAAEKSQPRSAEVEGSTTNGAEPLAAELLERINGG
jgi:hydroxymethylbilane synthase